MIGARRGVLLQGLALGVGAALLFWMARNTAANLDQRGMTLGFGFLAQPAGFEIGEGWLAFSPERSIARALLVGLANTATVAAVGWIMAVGLGFALGLLRLGSNPVLRGAVGAVVETLRNIPLLLLLFFLAASLHGLPGPQEALRPLPGVALSARGLAVPLPLLHAWHLLLGAGLVVLLFGWRRLGRVAPRALAGLLLALAASLLLEPPGWSVPKLERFNFAGGAMLSPEFTALLMALVLHHGAHLSEVVRGGVLAVPFGQWQAAAALGLSRGQAVRRVVLPQALRAMVPLLASGCVSLVKNSSLAVAIGFPDLVSVLNTTANQTGHGIETMLLMIGAYLTLSLLVAAALDRYNERILSRGARPA